MVINKKSWHYHVYDFSYTFASRDTPRQTNLCQYVRRMMFVAPFVGIGIACMFCVLVVVSACGVLGGPIFGYVPKQWSKPWDIFDGMHKYQGLKVGKSYNAFQLYPWHVLLAAIIVGIHVLMYHAWGGHPLVVEGEVVGAIVLAIAAMFGLFYYFDSSTGKVVNAYLTAKKQKVCPVVEFVNEDPTEE